VCDYVRERTAEWLPHDAFVLDVCATPTGLRIVEINTINSSAFYAADIQKLVLTLNDAFAI
jgi:spore maturation protein SpmA